MLRAWRSCCVGLQVSSSTLLIRGGSSCSHRFVRSKAALKQRNMQLFLDRTTHAELESHDGIRNDLELHQERQTLWFTESDWIRLSQWISESLIELNPMIQSAFVCPLREYRVRFCRVGFYFREPLLTGSQQLERETNAVWFFYFCFSHLHHISVPCYNRTNADVIVLLKS